VIVKLAAADKMRLESMIGLFYGRMIERQNNYFV
jgi:hypothetical protein